MVRLLGVFVTILVAIGAAILTWPAFFRLELTFPVAQIVSLRGAVVCAWAALAVLMLLLCLARSIRPFAAGIVVISLIAAAAGGGILVSRGLGSSSLPATTEQSIRVLTWNTAGDATDAQTIARAAVAMEADIVALPETTLDTGEAVAVAMRESGHPMWAHHESYQDRAGFSEWAANSTTLLISPDLGDYAVIESTSGDTSNTSRVPSVVAMPVDGDGPTIVVAHAVAPREGMVDDWQDDLRWLGDQCASDDVIMTGDFNATIDHMVRFAVDGGDLGRCRDAAAHTGNGAVGTWSTALPPLLGAPIDHVLATGDWTATGSTVIDGLDESGSDHRPLVVQLERTASPDPAS